MPIDSFRIECDRMICELHFWKNKADRYERTILAAIEALERNSTSAPVLEVLKSQVGKPRVFYQCPVLSDRK